MPVVCLTAVLNNELTLTPLSSSLYLCLGETCLELSPIPETHTHTGSNDHEFIISPVDLPLIFYK